MTDFSERLDRKLSSLRDLGLKRKLPGPMTATDRVCQVDGKELLNFSSNDYLALSGNDRVIERAHQALNEHGSAAGGSRLICGDHPLYQRLEEELADWKDRESALVFGSGYLTNIGLISSVTTGRDLILHDELAHRCLLEGARLSEADVDSFSHNDLDELETQLQSNQSDYDAVLVLLEGIYSMDGDRVPLQSVVDLVDRHGAWLLVDEAHSAGVWGPGGSGLTPSVDGTVEIGMGTLSKAFGGYGGYVVGSSRLKDYLVNRAPSFIYSTGLPPAVVAGNLAALEIIRKDDSRREQLKQRVTRLIDWMEGKDIPHPRPASQVVPLITGSVEDTVEAGDVLRELGIYAVPIRYPTVPRNQGRVRFSLRADHRSDDIDQLTEAIDELDERSLLKRWDLWTAN